MTEQVLSPCPFCGGEGEMHKEMRSGYEKWPNDPDAYAFFVVCVSCAASGGWGKTKGSGRRWWNMRFKVTETGAQGDVRN